MFSNLQTDIVYIMSKKRHNAMNFFQDHIESREFGQHNRGSERVLEETLVDYCLAGNEDAVIDLLQKGASPEGETFATAQLMAGENFKRPLMAAVVNGHRKIAQLLLENGADPGGKDKYKMQALHWAAHSGHRDCVQLLLDHGADADAETTDFNKPGVYKKPFRGGTTPLHMAAKLNHSGCIEELVERGKADLNKRDVIGMTCLHTACQLGHEESVLTILRISQGLEGNKLQTGSTLGTGNTPLHECVRCGLVRATEALLKRGAEVNKTTPTGFTPLHFALIQTNDTASELVRTLLLHGASIDVNLQNRGGLSPLHLVAFEPKSTEHIHHIHTLEFHMQRDHITLDPGRTRRDPQLACFLLQYGADFNINYHNITLIEQEIYAQDDDLILDMILRVTDSFRIPERPRQVPVMKSLAVGAPERASSLRNLFSKPRNLQHICRLLIRRVLTPSRLNRVGDLSIPEALKDYILLRS